MTSPDYASSISLLPTDDFLRYVANKQWGSEASYGVGFSPVIPQFYSTTNSEWLCLNSESEFLTSSLGTVAIKNPFSYTRPESSPVFAALNDISVKPQQIRGAKSLFLFRSIGTKSEVITVSSYAKSNTENVTTAPPLDCFSRECLSWFSSDVDWFVGFKNASETLPLLIDGDDGIVLSSSSDILSGLIPASTSAIPYSSIQINNTVSSLAPFVSLRLGTQISYSSESAVNTIFLFSVDGKNDSVVSFAADYTSPQTNIDYDFLNTVIYWENDVIVI